MCKLCPRQRRENNIAKQKKKKNVRASTNQGRKSIGFDYCAKDGTKLEARELTQEAFKETNLRKLQS